MVLKSGGSAEAYVIPNCIWVRFTWTMRKLYLRGMEQAAAEPAAEVYQRLAWRTLYRRQQGSLLVWILNLISFWMKGDANCFYKAQRHTDLIRFIVSLLQRLRMAWKGGSATGTGDLATLMYSHSFRMIWVPIQTLFRMKVINKGYGT